MFGLPFGSALAGWCALFQRLEFLKLMHGGLKLWQNVIQHLRGLREVSHRVKQELFVLFATAFPLPGQDLPFISGGWGGRDRTSEWRNQNPLPYRLATPHRLGGLGIAA